MIINTNKRKITSQNLNRKDSAKSNWSYRWVELKRLAYATMGRSCLNCGASNRVMHVDHIKPYSKYPHLRLSAWNVQVLCASCNISKGNVIETDYRSRGHIKAISNYVKENKTKLLAANIELSQHLVEHMGRSEKKRYFLNINRGKEIARKEKLRECKPKTIIKKRPKPLKQIL